MANKFRFTKGPQAGPRDEYSDWPADKPRPYLAHLPDTCGMCSQDHRLGVVHVSLPDLIEQYKKACLLQLLAPEPAGQYFIDLVGAELKYRYDRDHPNLEEN